MEFFHGVESTCLAYLTRTAHSPTLFESRCVSRHLLSRLRPPATLNLIFLHTCFIQRLFCAKKSECVQGCSLFLQMAVCFKKWGNVFFRKSLTTASPNSQGAHTKVFLGGNLKEMIRSLKMIFMLYQCAPAVFFSVTRRYRSDESYWVTHWVSKR